MSAPTPTPSSPANSPPPSRRAFAPHEKLVIGGVVVGLLLTATAILTLPAPGDGRSVDLPAVAAIDTVAPVVPTASTRANEPAPVSVAAVVDTTPVASRASAATPAPPVADKRGATTPPAKPTLTKSTALVAPPTTPPKKAAIKPVVKAPAKSREPSCAQLVAASSWNDAFLTCTAEAEKGVATAQRRLAELYVEGHGTGRNESAATKWYGDAANQGDVEAMFQFALSLEKGRGTKKDQSAALRWYTRAGDGGNAAAQYVLGQAYERGRLTAGKNKATALTWYRKAADQNFSDAANKVRELSR